MARLRTIKPGFFTDDELGECDPYARLLYAGLWVIADREGRLEDRPKRIKAEVQPYDATDVDALLTELARRGFIVRYQVDGVRYIAIPSWKKHQNPHIKEAESTIPAPPPPGKHRASTVQAPYENGSFPAGLVLGLDSGHESLTTPVDRGPGREADASTQPPVREAVPKPSRTAKATERVAAVEAALKAEGMSGDLTDKDERAIRKSRCPPEELARLYAAIFNGTYGDPYLQTNLSVALCLEKLPGWRSHEQGHRAPPRPRPTASSSVSRIDAVFKRAALNGHPTGRDLERERGRPELGLPPPGGRLPRQLPG